MLAALAVLASACSGADLLGDPEATTTSVTSEAVAPSTTARATTTTVPSPPVFHSIGDGGASLPRASTQLGMGLDAIWNEADRFCDLNAVVLLVPATADASGDGCERFDRASAVSLTSLTAVWAANPTACVSTDALAEAVAERSNEFALVQPRSADHVGLWLESRGLGDAARSGITRLGEVPTPEQLEGSGVRFLIASAEEFDVGSAWHQVLIDGGDGCAAPSAAEVVAGRYPFGTTWQLVVADGAPAVVVDAVELLLPEIEAAQSAAPPVDERYARPDWLGTALTELRPGTNYGVAQPTPPELRDRQLATVDLFPPPRTSTYEATIQSVPPEVVPRSTWSPACPVALGDLRYLTMTFWGFDQRPHTGEMIVNEDIAELTVDVFRQLYELKFPIEDMSVMPSEFWTNPPTGDDNITSSFECRRAVGGSGGWSNHALGLAIDINPFHNVYKKGTLILPEYAEAYLDRSDVRPGMIVEGDEVVAIFDALGWGWGGRWSSADDPMHFSVNGR